MFRIYKLRIDDTVERIAEFQTYDDAIFFRNHCYLTDERDVEREEFVRYIIICD